jgi:hypothetical protein
MIKMHIVQSSSRYTIGNLSFEDVAGLVIYLRARGVRAENILDAIEVLAREGEHTIQQEE